MFTLNYRQEKKMFQSKTIMILFFSIYNNTLDNC